MFDNSEFRNPSSQAHKLTSSQAHKMRAAAGREFPDPAAANNLWVDTTRLADLDSTATWVRLLAMSGMTLAKWQRIFFKSSMHFLRPSPTGAFRGDYGGTPRSFVNDLILVAIASLLFSSGCGVSSATTSVSKAEVAPANIEIDAGVIFADRSSYLCLPTSRFGISVSAKIETIVSSCDCVIASLVQYSDTSTTTADGVLFEFVPEETSPDTTSQPMQLGVVVTFTMVGGETRTVTASFLHTSSKVKRFQ